MADGPVLIDAAAVDFLRDTGSPSPLEWALRAVAEARGRGDRWALACLDLAPYEGPDGELYFTMATWWAER